MTFAELIALGVVCVLLYLALSPLRRILEMRLLRILKRKKKARNFPVIDITDYTSKKEKQDEQ